MDKYIVAVVKEDVHSRLPLYVTTEEPLVGHSQGETVSDAPQVSCSHFLVSRYIEEPKGKAVVPDDDPAKVAATVATQSTIRYRFVFPFLAAAHSSFSSSFISDSRENILRVLKEDGAASSDESSVRSFVAFVDLSGTISYFSCDWCHENSGA